MHGYVGIERGSGCILHASGLYDRYLHSQNIRIFMSCLIHFQGLFSSGLACQSELSFKKSGECTKRTTRVIESTKAQPRRFLVR